MYVSAVAEVSAHWCHERFAIGRPLSGFHDRLIPFVFGASHALIHCLSNNGCMFDYCCPWRDLVDPCSHWLFSEEEPSKLHLFECNLSTEFDVG